MTDSPPNGLGQFEHGREKSVAPNFENNLDNADSSSLESRIALQQRVVSASSCQRTGDCEKNDGTVQFTVLSGG